VGWPGDLAVVAGLAGATFCWLSSQLPVFRAAARPRVKLETPAAVAAAGARAGTNELDAGKRWPVIGGEEEPAGCGLSWEGCVGLAGWVRRSAEWVSQPPIRPPAWRGP
jgi:hypothetical protein